MQEAAKHSKSRVEELSQDFLLRKVLSPDSTPPISSDDDNFSDHAEEIL